MITFCNGLAYLANYKEKLEEKRRNTKTDGRLWGCYTIGHSSNGNDLEIGDAVDGQDGYIAWMQDRCKEDITNMRGIEKDKSKFRKDELAKDYWLLDSEEEILIRLNYAGNKITGVINLK